MIEFERINGFRSPTEYSRFLKWVEAHIQSGEIHEVPVLESYGSPYFSERWVKKHECSEIWRIVAPEPPFRGLFKLVE